MPERIEVYFSSKVKLVEDNKTEKGRTAEFQLRAKSLGIVEEKLVAQKVAIWGGMWAAKQIGDDIEYWAWVLLDCATGDDQ